ncbi:GNAT family N-acetyltransferase [Pararhizobium sp. LjRoot235]|uniref:GNAT family N-acetyltransferase n=1 Tax=Pararhizobium sp. LjRoot235 TaxID=3342291 RepID=UPI003ECF0BDF
MIALRPMKATEFAAYLAYFIRDYAAEIAANYGLSETEGFARASREIADHLPDGPQTPGEVLLCIVNEADDHVGYLWYRPAPGERSAFISDFHILAAHQGRGYGRQALNALETHLAESGIAEIRLRVAADNERAQHVYKTSGFQTTGINMSKRIGEP